MKYIPQYVMSRIRNPVTTEIRIDHPDLGFVILKRTDGDYSIQVDGDTGRFAHEIDSLVGFLHEVKKSLVG